MILKTRAILKVTQVILERKTSQRGQRRQLRRQRRTLKSKSDNQGLSLSVALTPPFWVAAEPSLLVFINASKDTIDCPEKAMKISHFNQTKYLLSIL